MKILIVDDQKVPAESLKLAIESSIGTAKVSIHQMFDTAFEAIQDQSPDVLVLDIFKNPAQDENAGDAVRKQVWDSHFCPIIIYTARPQESHKESKHPFVTLCEKKGTKESEGEVVAKLNSFKSHTDVLRRVRQQAHKAIGDSLRDVCNVIWTDRTADKDEVIGRIARRRVAAMMDESSLSDSGHRPWEQYIFPPLSHHLLTGDILKKSGTTTNTIPSEFFVVIWPSCDLVQRKGCVEQVLVAECGPIADFLRAAELEGVKKAAKLTEKLPKLFTRDQVNGVLCLPALPSVFPLMAINLKKLRLIGLKGIRVLEQIENETHHRLASVDSPFRERLSFAFTQVAGRPGLPDIDWQQCIDSISESVNKTEEPAETAQAAGPVAEKPPAIVTAAKENVVAAPADAVAKAAEPTGGAKPAPAPVEDKSSEAAAAPKKPTLS